MNRIRSIVSGWMSRSQASSRSKSRHRAYARAATMEGLEGRLLMSTTYYLAPGGSDGAAGTSSAAWATASHAYSKMGAGDTLVLEDGTYNQQSLLSSSVMPPSGTAGAYTVIKAQHVGAAIIDGQSSTDPICLAGPPSSPVQYIQFDGLVFRHQASGAQVYGVNHVKFTQDGFEDAGSGNTSTFMVNNSSYVLAEDCYAWGSGRYKFISYESNNIIFRRDVARIDAIDAGGQPMAGIAVYTSNNVELQNDIVIDGNQSQFWTNIGEYDGAFSIPSTNGPSTNINITGCVALNDATQFVTLTKQLSNVNITNSVGWNLREGVFARDSAAFNHVTIGNITGPAQTTQTVGMQWVQALDPVNSTSMNNSILENIKGTALNSWNSENNNDFYGNNVDRTNTPTGSKSISANPSLKYILSTSGASSSITGKASDGGDMGANITKEIGVSGTLYGDSGYNTVTGTDLWPFPNETLIGTMMRSYSYSGSAGTLSGNRGFAATGQTLTNYIWTYLGAANPYSGTVTAPTAPSNLAATAAGATGTNLTWTNNASNATALLVERQTSGGAWSQIASLGGSATSYSDSGLTAGTAYGYRVRASNSAGTSAYSNTATATPVLDTTPPVISAMSATGITSSTATIGWTTNKASTSQVQYGTTTSYGSTTTLNSTLTASHSVTVSGLPASTVMHYRVVSTDASGNVATSADYTCTTAAPNTGPFDVFAPTATPTNTADADPSSAVLGMKFTSDVAGSVTGVRFYKGTGNTGTHIGYLWDASGNQLASVTFAGETASGWQQANFATPVAINASTTYTIGYVAPAGHFAGDDNFFTAPVNNGSMHGINSLYTYGAAGVAPSSNYQNCNYWVDVVVTTNPAPTTNGLTVTTLSASAGSVTSGRPVTFTAKSAAVTGTTTPTGTITFKDGSTVLATVALSNGTATWSSSSLAVGSHSITAVYGGNTTYSGGTSATLTETITTPTTPPTTQGNLFTANGDIGSPKLKGSSSYNSATGTHTVTGSGSDIWNGSDQFQYDYTTKSGNSTLIAKVTSVKNTNVWAKGGVMFRNSTAANSAFADIVAAPGGYISFQWRTTAGASAQAVTLTGITGPVYLKLVRSGNTFSGFYSTNGTTWIQVGKTQTITMSTSIDAGLVACSHTTSVLSTSTFTNVSLV